MRAGSVSSACLSLNDRRVLGAASPAPRIFRAAPSLPSLHRLRGHAFAALRHHVGVAAGIDVPAPVALRHHDGRHGAVEEIAVVRHQQHRAGIVVDHLFQQIERFEIEIVGRLVEHQQVRRFGQRARQREPAALAAGQRRDRRSGLLRREQEILHVADDVARLPADEHRVAAPAGQRVAHRRIRIERLAALVERRHLQVDAERDLALVRRELAGQHLQQRRLAGAVRSDQPDAVAALDADREVAHDRRVAEALRDALRLGHQLAGQLRLAHRDLHVALRAAVLAEILAQSAPAAPTRRMLRLRRAVTP